MAKKRTYVSLKCFVVQFRSIEFPQNALAHHSGKAPRSIGPRGFLNDIIVLLLDPGVLEHNTDLVVGVRNFF